MAYIPNVQYTNRIVLILLNIHAFLLVYTIYIQFYISEINITGLIDILFVSLYN